MRKSRYSDSQILAILKQNENGIAVPELYREHGMSSAQFYKWRAKFGGMDASMMKRLKELEDENRRLKKMYAEKRLKADCNGQVEPDTFLRGVSHGLFKFHWRLVT